MFLITFASYFSLFQNIEQNSNLTNFPCVFIIFLFLPNWLRFWRFQSGKSIFWKFIRMYFTVRNTKRTRDFVQVFHISQNFWRARRASRNDQVVSEERMFDCFKNKRIISIVNITKWEWWGFCLSFSVFEAS